MVNKSDCRDRKVRVFISLSIFDLSPVGVEVSVIEDRKSKDYATVQTNRTVIWLMISRSVKDWRMRIVALELIKQRVQILNYRVLLHRPGIECSFVCTFVHWFV